MFDILLWLFVGIMLGVPGGMFIAKERAAGRSPQQILDDAKALAEKVAAGVKK